MYAVNLETLKSVGSESVSEIEQHDQGYEDVEDFQAPNQELS